MVSIENILEPHEVAQLLGVTEGTLKRWRQVRSHLPFHRTSARHVVYLRDDVEAFIAARRTETKPAAVAAS